MEFSANSGHGDRFSTNIWFYQLKIPIIKKRRSQDCLIFIIGIPISSKKVFILKRSPYQIQKQVYKIIFSAGIFDHADICDIYFVHRGCFELGAGQTVRFF